MPEQRKPREFRFEIAPDSVTFHLFETVEVQSADTAAGDVPSKLSVVSKRKATAGLS